ncbi:hypothetical protein [Nonomuraea sp. NPDC049480]|uniref:hypothetical protein n=1 Tax=Nonomuraea sp. NPDC049480 TaxID=3364353 RepID=UPI0037AE4108
MRPAYGLTDPYDARRFLSEESPATRFVPSGNASRDAGKITNVHNLTSPYRSEHSPRPSGDEALAALTLLADLRDWLADVEPDLIQAARSAGVTWDALAPVLRVGDRRAAQRASCRPPLVTARPPTPARTSPRTSRTSPTTSPPPQMSPRPPGGTGTTATCACGARTASGA